MAPRAMASTGDFDGRSRPLPTPELLERQERLRRIVGGVLATAVLILLVAGIRTAVGKSAQATAEPSPASAPPPAAQAAAMGLAPAEIPAAPAPEPAPATVPAADSKPAAAPAPKGMPRTAAPHPRAKGKSPVGAKPF
jgi:hypothetical protein